MNKEMSHRYDIRRCFHKTLSSLYAKERNFWLFYNEFHETFIITVTLFTASILMLASRAAGL